MNSPLSSILAFAKDLKQIETPHTLFRDFGADKTFTAVGKAGEFKFEPKFEPLPVIP